MEGSSIKRDPFTQSNENVKLDSDFFRRLKRIESRIKYDYHQGKNVEAKLKTLQKVNEVLQQKELSLNDVRAAIEILNRNSKDYDLKDGWLDVILHLRQISFIYGEERKMNENSQLIKVE